MNSSDSLGSIGTQQNTSQQHNIDPRLNTFTNQPQPQQNHAAAVTMARTWIDPAASNIVYSTEDLTQRIEHPFWSTQTTLITSSGRPVQGAYVELLQYEELAPEIMARFRAVAPTGTSFPATRDLRGNILAGSSSAFGGAHSSTTPANQEREVTSDSNTLAADPYPKLSTHGATGSGAAIQAPPQSPSESFKDSEDAEDESDSDADPSELATTGNSTLPSAGAAAPVTIPGYVSDILSAQAAREAVAHPAAQECKLLEIENDDVQVVKEDLHVYAKMIYDALLTPGWDSGAIEDHMGHHKDPAFRTKMKAKFDEQKIVGMAGMRSKMQTDSQAQRVRANCLLAVDAAIFVHEHGVPAKVLKASKGKAEERRSASVDSKSSCSKRLEKMATAVANHKLVAEDVTTGTNLHDFAYDPDAYVLRKISYLKSNISRQFTQDNKKAAKEESGAGAKRKRDADGTDDFSGVSGYGRGAKRAK